MTRYGLVLGALLAATGTWAQGPQPPDIEAAVLEALERGRPDDLAAPLSAIRSLSAAARRDLPVRVYGDVVEFQFRGRFPGKEFQPERFEFVVARPGKEYETLLVVAQDEAARLDRLGVALRGLAKKSKVAPLEIKFAWEERGEARVEDLRDLLGLESAQKREAFLRGLTFYPRGGLGQENVRADPARLPASGGPTRVVVAVRLAKAVPDK
jgi:hypothetical protein